MKLTDAQRNDLWVLLRDHRGGTRDALQEVLDLCERMLSENPELPQWRDPVLDPPSDDDLSLDGEVLVRDAGGLYCTDRAGLPPDARWLCVKDLVGLPMKDYAGRQLGEEMRMFEEAFPFMDQKKAFDGGNFVDLRTQAAWIGWLTAKGLA